MKIILASSSPRRIKILEEKGFEFEVHPIKLDEEKFMKNLPPEGAAKKIALTKALMVAEKVKNGIIIGADTIVVYGNTVFGKPKNHEEAVKMLRMLSGKMHEVITAISIIEVKDGKKCREYVECVKTKVKMMELSEEEINAYVNTGEPLDKAGAYAIQGLGGIFVEWINGCYYNVIGLPIAKLYKLLKKMDVTPSWIQQT
ncbi:MAG: Maf family protein [Candidatus Baldrarchaeia archaeon]